MNSLHNPQLVGLLQYLTRQKWPFAVKLSSTRLSTDEALLFSAFLLSLSLCLSKAMTEETFIFEVFHNDDFCINGFEAVCSEISDDEVVRVETEEADVEMSIVSAGSHCLAFKQHLRWPVILQLEHFIASCCSNVTPQINSLQMATKSLN